MEIEIRAFNPEDNLVYAEWFENSEINRYLGPAWDEKELDEIFSDKSGAVLSVYRDKKMVGVVSIAYPEETHQSYGIMGVAVAPDHQRQGVGGLILEALQSYYKTKNGQRWLSFVSVENENAHQFLRKHGWQKVALENGMVKYTYEQQSA